MHLTLFLLEYGGDRQQIVWSKDNLGINHPLILTYSNAHLLDCDRMGGRGEGGEVVDNTLNLQQCIFPSYSLGVPIMKRCFRGKILDLILF